MVDGRVGEVERRRRREHDLRHERRAGESLLVSLPGGGPWGAIDEPRRPISVNSGHGHGHGLYSGRKCGGLAMPCHAISSHLISTLATLLRVDMPPLTTRVWELAETPADAAASKQQWQATEGCVWDVV